MTFIFSSRSPPHKHNSLKPFFFLSVYRAVPAVCNVHRRGEFDTTDFVMHSSLNKSSIFVFVCVLSRMTMSCFYAIHPLLSFVFFSTSVLGKECNLVKGDICTVRVVGILLPAILVT